MGRFWQDSENVLDIGRDLPEIMATKTKEAKKCDILPCCF